MESFGFEHKIWGQPLDGENCDSFGAQLLENAQAADEKYSSKAMILWDIKSELLALQRLYGLLKKDGDGMTNPASNMLDNQARVILKHLLDSATQRSLKVYSDVLAGQVGVLGRRCVSHMQQTDNTINEHFSRLQMNREVDQSYRNDMGRDKETKVNGLHFKLCDDQKLTRQRSQVDSIEQSTPSADATSDGFRNKCCRVCQRSTIKPLVANDAPAKYSNMLTYPNHEENIHSDHVPQNIEQEIGLMLSYKTNESKTDKRRHIGALKWGTCGKKHPPNTTATLKKCSHQSVRQHKNGVATSRNYMNASRTSLNQQELEDTTSSLYSSNMRNQQASRYGGVGEDQTGSHHVTSSTSSENLVSPLSHGIKRDYDSKGEEDLYSSTTGSGAPEVTSSIRGKIGGYSPYNQPMNRLSGYSYSSIKSTSRKKVSRTVSKSVSGINHQNPSNIWKRLKDGLSVVSRHLHHHHHHHHHHGSSWKKMNDSTHLKKLGGKILHSKQGDEAYGERAVVNMKKSVIHDKYQNGHFHGLVKAFLGHIWHSKKSNKAKGAHGKLAKKQRGLKKTLKLSQHHKRRNFPINAHVKLGLCKKKKPFKTLRS